jgi:ACS family hexuronate transporter-like MFS transporter
MVSMVALATMINYIDRNALALMWPAMGPDLGMDKEDYSYILSFFLVSYAIGQGVFGKVFDVIGTRMGFFISIFICLMAGNSPLSLSQR